MREVGYTETPDKVAYNDSGLDLPRLEEYFEELWNILKAEHAKF